MIDRRTLLGRSAAMAGAALLGPRVGRALAAGTPAAGADLPELAITVLDDGFTVNEPVSTGLHRVTVTNAGNAPSHVSLGRVPDAFTDEQFASVTDDDPANDQLSTEQFFEIRFVGLPDWPAPGEHRTGIVDIAEPGRYVLVDPFSTRIKLFTVEGTPAAQATEPESTAAFSLQEMSIMPSTTELTAGPARWRIENVGAFSHELAVLPVGDGLTADELGAYLAWALSIPDGATPDPSTPVPGNGKIDLTTYAPVAAMSILRPGGRAWIDVDLPPGTYAALCMLPGPTDDVPPHAMLGMYAILTAK